jgi:CHRD domain
MRRLTFAATLGGAVAGLLVFAVMASATRQARQSLPQSFGKGFQAQMTGANETPAGDPDGTGAALIRLDPNDGLVCFELTVSGIDPAVAAHIHHAPAGQSGQIVVGLVAPAQATGESKGCVQADPTLIQDISANPSQYYVNVHNPAFPAGAVRGQLTPLSEKAPKPKIVTKIVRVHDCKGKKKHR